MRYTCSTGIHIAYSGWEFLPNSDKRLLLLLPLKVAHFKGTTIATMRKLHKSIIFIFLLSLQIDAQAKTSIWKVEKSNRTLYLAGTMHLMQASDYPLPKTFEDVFSIADTVYFEADIGTFNSAETQSTLARVMNYPAGESLQPHLKPETFSRLKQYFNQRGINFKPLSNLRVGFVGVNIALLEANTLGFTAKGIDQYFYEKTKQANKNFGFFETAEQQLNFIAQLGVGYEDAYIQYALEDAKDIPEVLPAMRDAWQDGDTRYFNSEIVLEMQREYPELYDTILAQRNFNWMPTIVSLINSPETEMVLVGNLHLIGKDGLVQLLREKGFSLTQM